MASFKEAVTAVAGKVEGQRSVNTSEIQQLQALLTLTSEKTLAAFGTARSFDFGAIKPFFQRVWSKFLGDSIWSQSVANILFELFLQNAPIAEQFILTWFEQKTGIPKSEIDATIIAKLNEYARSGDGIAKFTADAKAFFKAQTKSWFSRTWYAIKAFFKGF